MVILSCLICLDHGGTTRQGKGKGARGEGGKRPDRGNSARAPYGDAPGRTCPIPAGSGIARAVRHALRRSRPATGQPGGQDSERETGEQPGGSQRHRPARQGADHPRSPSAVSPIRWGPFAGAFSAASGGLIARGPQKRPPAEPIERESKRTRPAGSGPKYDGFLRIVQSQANYGELENGAGEGNRTLVVSLGSFCSTIELHPRSRAIGTAGGGGQWLCWLSAPPRAPFP